MALSTSAFPTAAGRLDTFFDPAQPRTTFEDTDIDEVASLLQQCGQHAASRCPRTYIVLRTIDQLKVFEQMLSDGFGDQEFPVGNNGQDLPSFLDPRIKSRIVESQRIIMTKSLDLEHGRHRHFASGEPLPFDIGDRLGSGGSGQVNKIVSKISFKEYALKRIHRRTAYGNNSKEAVVEIVSEIKIIKTLAHRHIVRYIGSYTDTGHLGLVISPVADCDLAHYIQQACIDSEKRSTLQMFFGCLATALCYLHGNSIKHSDIKPQNILIYKSDVLITDFGLARDYLDTTSGPTLLSPRYCSPEVAAYEARNMSADIWSLGCVFLDMVAALQGYDIDWLRRRFENVGTMSTHYHANPQATQEILGHWEASLNRRDTIPLTWIRKMILVDRSSRPTAAQVLEMITCRDDPDCSATTFCCISCAADDQAVDQNDSVGSLMDIAHNESEHSDQVVVPQRNSRPVLERESAIHIQSLALDKAVFQVSVDMSIVYAKVEISSPHKSIRPKFGLEGYIPIVVAQCSTYIFKKAHYFSNALTSFKSNNAANVIKLRTAFDTPPSYGSDIDWTKYSASEAGETLYTYLCSLPEPLIPAAVARQLALVGAVPLDGIDTRTGTDASALQSYVRILATLSMPRHHLLLYLLRVFEHYTGHCPARNTIKSIAKKYHSAIVRLNNPIHDADVVAINIVRFMIGHSTDFSASEEKRQWVERQKRRLEL
ncbi:kinase-like domain-containing protein [Pyrenochaeta sp. MPI-SDFR-AT-0127]|nr:kinase-like domain-containing protein [Pyrenochaeta sp. MPI-SDFR-AT-0127]